MQMTVYGRATSSNVQAVMWGAAELGLAPERLDYGFNFGGTDSSEFRALSPHGLVPVLKDGDTVVWESCAILRYLAARYGDGGAFWPADPAARARVDMWAEWGKTTLGPALLQRIFWPKVRLPASDRDEAALARDIAAFDGLLRLLADQMAGPFVLGDDFTLADVVIGHLLYRWFSMDIERPANPAIEAYYDRLSERPAFAAHVMIDFAILKHPEA